MKKHEIITYSIDELCESAKDKAYENWLNSHETNYLYYEYEPVLNRFCEIFGIKLSNWEVDAYTYSYSYRAPDWEENLCGNRLAKYILNNFYSRLVSPKIYYSKNFFHNHKERESAIMVNRDCVLTGFFADDEILFNIYNCVDYIEKFASVEDLFDACFDQFFDCLRNELEYQNSMEYFIEDCEANGCEFLANGERF